MGTFAKSPDSPPLVKYSARILSVTDGDTLRVLIQPRPHRWEAEILRLIGVDCPEYRTPEGKLVRDMVLVWIRTYQTLFETQDLGDLPFEVFTHLDKRDKYGRLLAYLRARHDGEELNQWILDNNLVKSKQGKWSLPRFQMEIGIKS